MGASKRLEIATPKVAFWMLWRWLLNKPVPNVGFHPIYVRMFDDKYLTEGDNPTIGLILCAKKNETIARYSILNHSKQLFASKYMLYLPTEEELRRALERERRLFEEAPSERDVE